MASGEVYVIMWIVQMQIIWLKIENVYKQIAGALLHGRKHLLKKSGNYNVVPGWNEYCKMAY